MLDQVDFADWLLFFEWTLEKYQPAYQSLKLNKLLDPRSLNYNFLTIYEEQVACDECGQGDAWIHSQLWQALTVVKDAELSAFVELNFWNLNNFVVCLMWIYVKASLVAAIALFNPL